MEPIIIVKRPSILREGIVHFFHSHYSDFKVYVYDTMEQFLHSENVYTSSLLIIDMDQEMDFIYYIEKLNQHHKVIVWISNIDENNLTQLFQYNLHGYFHNGMREEELSSAIGAILNDNQYIHPSLSSILLNDYCRVVCSKVERPNGILSNREWEVLELIAKGENNKDIGQHLFISPTTVNNHIGSILRKLAVKDRTSAALLAVKNKWIALY